MSKLQYEIRSSFVDESQITFSSTSQMTVMNAVIHETFRLYPPVPVALLRLTSKEGAIVAGTYIPPNTFIGIPQYSAYRSSRNFANPDKYAPERFLGNEEYSQDKRSIIQPFSVGPRNCIGQNMARAVIRTILARLMWHFDFELLDESRDSEKQKVFALWSKPSLMVNLKVRNI
jgi:cytochrome P450